MLGKFLLYTPLVLIVTVIVFGGISALIMAIVQGGWPVALLILFILWTLISFIALYDRNQRR